MSKMIKKKPRPAASGEVEEIRLDHTVVGEEGEELLYISKRQLKEQIKRSQLLSTLLYQSEISLSGEEQD